MQIAAELDLEHCPALGRTSIDGCASCGLPLCELIETVEYFLALDGVNTNVFPF